MTRIIGYTYEADCHCIACAQQRFAVAPRYLRQKYFKIDIDENGINPVAIDNENNPIHPIFDTDELSPNGTYCGGCRALIAPGYQV